MQSDEQLTNSKEFFKKYGVLFFSALISIFAIVFGWKAWVQYQESKWDAVSTLYQQLISESNKNTGEKNIANIVEINNKINSDYSNTIYAQFSRLVVAKIAVESNDFDEAINQLNFVFDNAKNNEIKEIAKIRLARVYNETKNFDKGLELLNLEYNKSYTGIIEELKGDLLYAKKEYMLAKKAYEKSLTVFEDPDNKNRVKMKLANLIKDDE